MKRKRSHIKLRYGILLLAMICFGIVIGYWFFHQDPYAQLTTIDKNTKTVGEIMHKKDTKKDAYYTSIYYPKTEYAPLNEAIQEYISKVNEQVNQSKTMQVFTVDYEIHKIFDHYVSLTFHQKVYDEHKQQKQQSYVSYNYDMKQNKLLSVKDVLRRDYISHLHHLAREKNISTEITKDHLNNFIIREKELCFYFENDINTSITLPYEKHKAYIHLNDPNIPSYYAQQSLSVNQQTIDPNKKMIALTFDDGPHPENTKKIMDALESYGGRSTFFMLGKNVKQYPDLVKEVHQRGHEVANHSWDHSFRIAASLSNPMNKQEVSDELYDTNDEIYKTIGFEPTLFRPPFGAINTTLRETCEMPMVLWDVDSRDWESHNPTSIHNIIVDGVKQGNQVILLHDIHKESVDGLISTLKDLHKEGYQFVTVSTLLQYKEKELTTTNKDPLHNVVVTPLSKFN